MMELEPQDLELQVVVGLLMWVLGTKLGSFEGEVWDVHYLAPSSLCDHFS